MRRATTAALLAVLCCTPVFAQMSGEGSPTPTIGATSPLGIPSGSPVPPTGIPLGATELSSPGVSPLSTGASGMPGYGTTCPGATSALSGMSSSVMSSSSTTYDGGGMQAGAALPGSTGTLEICGTNSSSTAATSPTTPGGAPRTGIPLGAVQIGNAGVSPEAMFPTPGQSPLMASPSSFTPARPFSRVPAP
jgi:hypothetical protein